MIGFIFGFKLNRPSMNLRIYKRDCLSSPSDVCVCVDREGSGLTAPKATESMVCMRASSMELITPLLLSRARPASVQNRTFLMPTDTNWVSESGRNSATNILWVWPERLATLAPGAGRGFVSSAGMECRLFPSGTAGPVRVPGSV